MTIEMSKILLVYGFRTGRRVVTVLLLACLLTTGVVAGGVTTGDGGQPGDAADERTDARQIEAGETVEGNLSDGDDVDWYAVDATAGEAVVATLELLNVSGNRSVEINVYDPSGNLGTEEERDKMSGPERVAGKRPGSTEEPTADAPDVAESTGTYYVEVRESWWNETDEGVSSPYTLAVTTEALDQYDPNENASTATSIDVGQSIEGVMAPYDHDVFAVDLIEGENYTVTFNHTNASASRFSKMMTLHTDASNVTDDDPGYGIWGHRITRNTSGTYTAQESGTHYLRLGQSGITATLLDRAEYRLTVARTDSSTDDGTDGSDDRSDGGGAPADDSETTADGDSQTPDESAETPTDDDTAMPPQNDSETTVEDGAGDGTPSGTATTTDAGTRTPADRGDTTSTDGETVTMAGGGGGSNEATTTPSPTADGGPGFGVVVALVSLLGVASLARRRSR